LEVETTVNHTEAPWERSPHVPVVLHAKTQGHSVLIQFTTLKQKLHKSLPAQSEQEILLNLSSRLSINPNPAQSEQPFIYKSDPGPILLTTKTERVITTG
jgi:hypothetical protein